MLRMLYILFLVVLFWKLSESSQIDVYKGITLSEYHIKMGTILQGEFKGFFKL